MCQFVETVDSTLVNLLVCYSSSQTELHVKCKIEILRLHSYARMHLAAER